MLPLRQGDERALGGQSKRIDQDTKKWPEKKSKCNGSDFKEPEIFKILLVDKIYSWKLIVR